MFTMKYSYRQLEKIRTLINDLVLYKISRKTLFFNKSKIQLPFLDWLESFSGNANITLNE